MQHVLDEQAHALRGQPRALRRPGHLNDKRAAVRLGREVRLELVAQLDGHAGGEEVPDRHGHDVAGPGFEIGQGVDPPHDRVGVVVRAVREEHHHDVVSGALLQVGEEHLEAVLNVGAVVELGKGGKGLPALSGLGEDNAVVVHIGHLLDELVQAVAEDVGVLAKGAGVHGAGLVQQVDDEHGHGKFGLVWRQRLKWTA